MYCTQTLDIYQIIAHSNVIKMDQYPLVTFITRRPDISHLYQTSSNCLPEGIKRHSARIPVVKLVPITKYLHLSELEIAFFSILILVWVSYFGIDGIFQGISSNFFFMEMSIGSFRISHLFRSLFFFLLQFNTELTIDLSVGEKDLLKAFSFSHAGRQWFSPFFRSQDYWIKYL